MKPTDIRRAALASSLRAATIFNGLPDDVLLRIAGYSSVRKLRKNDILFREGEKVVGFFIVAKGMIEAFRADETGREQLIHLIHAGESFAEPAVAGLPGYPAHTRALEPTEVIQISGDEFLAHLRERSDLAMRMLGSLSRHLHELVSTIESYKLRDAETRLLHWLIRRCPAGNKPALVTLGVSKMVLAAELGTRQETLSRIFAKLKKSGQIAVSGREITIPSPVALKKLFESQLASKSAA
jgi:CRP-like cAMP-binding protein